MIAVSSPLLDILTHSQPKTTLNIEQNQGKQVDMDRSVEII